MKRLPAIALIGIAGLSFASPAVARPSVRKAHQVAKATAAPKPTQTQTTAGWDLKAPSVKIRLVH